MQLATALALADVLTRPAVVYARGRRLAAARQPSRRPPRPAPVPDPQPHLTRIPARRPQTVPVGHDLAAAGRRLMAPRRKYPRRRRDADPCLTASAASGRRRAR